MQIKGMAAITLKVYSRTLTFSLLSERSILEATFFFFPSLPYQPQQPIVRLQ